MYIRYPKIEHTSIKQTFFGAPNFYDQLGTQLLRLNYLYSWPPPGWPVVNVRNDSLANAINISQGTPNPSGFRRSLGRVEYFSAALRSN